MDIHGSLQLLNSSHVRERDKALLRAIMVGGVWNGFLLGRIRGQPVPCRFCGAPDHDGHLFWECTFPPLVEIRENPEFHDLMRMDKAHWPRCLLWHVGCLCSLAVMVFHLGLVMPLRVLITWLKLLLVITLLGWFLIGVLLLGMIGLLFLPSSRITPMFGLMVDLIHPVGNVPSCRGFCSVPGPFHSVQRAELWGVILALQSSGAVHLGVDNLGVVRHVGRLLVDCPVATPFEVVNDGDLLFLIDRMLHLRGRDTVRISEVKGHADDSMVLGGGVREVDRLGNDAADRLLTMVVGELIMLS